VTDSQDVQRGVSEWLERWRATAWKTAKGDPVANRELWEELVSLAQDHKTHWRAGSALTGKMRTSSGVMPWRRKQLDRLSVMDERQDCLILIYSDRP
jgi:hypothetical protein